MRLGRTIFQTLSVLAVFLGGAAQGQDYPKQPIRLITPFPPGGGADVTARLAAEALTRQLGQQVVVENRAGATGALGTAYVAKAKPDGYTLLWTSLDNYTIGPAIRSDLPYKVEDLTLIARLAENGHVYAVNSSRIAAKTLPEFISYLKAHPMEVRYGTNGVGSANHLSMAVFEEAAGVKLTRVVYQGMAPTITDLLAGRLEIVPLTPSAVMPYLNSDNLRFLTIAQSTRNPLFPDLPTTDELGYPNATVSVWYGMAGPKGLPDDIRKTLEKAMAGVLADPEVKRIMSERGLSPAPAYGDELRDLVVKETAKWKELASKNNIKAE